MNGGAARWTVSAPVVAADPGLEIDPAEIDKLFAKYGDDDDDDDGGKRNAADNKAKATTRASNLVNRVVVDETARKRYKSDVLGTIQGSVAPYNHPEELANFADQIDDMDKWRDRRRETETRLWQLAEVRFIDMVEAKTKDPTLLVRVRLQGLPGVNSEANEQIQRQNIAGAANPQQGPPQPQQANLAVNGGDSDGMTYRGIVPGDVAAFAPIGADGKPSVAMYNNNVLRTVGRIMQAPDVTGEYKMSSLLYASVVDGLTRIATQNPAKFGKAKADHFYKDDKVMNMFAEVVSLLIKISRIQNPDTYNNNAVEPRRAAQVASALTKLDLYTVYSSGLQGYRFATPDEIARTLRDKEEMLLGGSF